MDIVGEVLADIFRPPPSTTQSYQKTTDKDSKAEATKGRRSESGGESKDNEDATASLSSSTAGPPSRFEIFEHGPNGMVELTMEIPGVASEDVSVEVENGTLLRIRGSRTRQPLEEEEEKVNGGASRRRRSNSKQEVVKQRPAAFEEVFVLDDDMNVDELRVTLWRGILTVQIPRKAKVVRRIPIRLERDETRDNDDDSTPQILKAVQRKAKDSNKRRKNFKSSQRPEYNEEEDGEEGLQFLDEDDDASSLI
jgi:HSP20 family molecular chaperone IbpA